MRDLEIRCSTELDFNHDDESFNPTALTLGDEGIISYNNGKLFQHITDGTQSEIIDLEPYFVQESTNVKNEVCTGMLGISGGRVVISFKSGLLICVEINVNTAEIVGNLAVGLEGAWKSPDDELLVLGASDGLLILMTSGDFEPLLEFDPDEATDAAFANVNVGWGAKETQFHGKAGKAAREIATDIPESAVVEGQDDCRVKVVWRDDGQFFAVSYVSKLDQVRRIRIFNREGQLQSTSEPVSNLGSSLAWKPSGGALIASSMKLSNGIDVIGFFEKNGLRHGEFSLPFPAEVHNLCWNSDASVLAIHLTNKKSGEDVLQLWTVSNYKWQLKKSEYFPKNFNFLWDPVSPMSLYVVCSQNQAYAIELKFKVHRSLHSRSKDDLSYVAVTEGSVLKVTPFKEMVVPPPISAFELHFDHNISHVVTSAHPECLNSMLVITDDNMIHIIDPEGGDESNVKVKLTGAGGQGFVPKCTTLKIKKSSKLVMDELDINLNCFAKVCWAQPNILFLVEHGEKKLVSLSLDTMTVNQELMLEDDVSEIISSSAPDNNHETNVYVVLVDGTVLKIDNINDKSASFIPLDFSIPSNCSQIELYQDYSKSFQDYFLSLNERNQRLYVNGQEVASGITSFFIHSDFLMATTVKHTLKCLPLSEMSNFSKESFWISESVRALERGSKLVVAVASDTKTVLQMPRGNLEVIHPRALALQIIKQLLNKCDYKKTMEILRRQRINLNLIVDHNIELFKTNIKKFIESINSMDRLCVFIADLVPEDVTKTMYESMYCNDAKLPSSSDKVDSVCDLLLKSMSQDKEKYILPIISCHVKSSKSKIDDALLEIKSLKNSGHDNIADEALNFILLLVNVNALFDVALGLYDFDLVLYVAERSQKDPKEYLPFLNDLKKLPEVYRKHKIDVHLKRYKSALKHIVDCGEDYLEECIGLIKDQRLYLDAMPMFKPKTKGHTELCQSYGDYLLTKKYFEDAALIYESGGLLVQAVSAWEQSNNWSLCLALAKSVLIKPNQNDFTNLCKRIVEKLKDTQRHKEAAQVLLEYLNDPEEAVVSLIEGHEWFEALRLIDFHQRPDLIETNFKPSLLEYTEEVTKTLDKKIASFDDYIKRLIDVVAMKEKLAQGDVEDVDINLEDADMYSDVTSQAGSLGQSMISKVKSNPGSLKTRVSKGSKSSRSRRKQELKKYSTKEGSKYEDLGLMAALHDLISQTYKSTFGEISQLIRVLYKFGKIETAKSLQGKLKDLDQKFIKNESVIWSPKWLGNSTAADFSENKFGPEATTEDVVNKANLNEGYKPELSLLETKYRYPPLRPPNNDWFLQILE